MILLSFSSAEDALSDDVKKEEEEEIFSSQGRPTENPQFRFLGTPGIYQLFLILLYCKSIKQIYIDRAWRSPCHFKNAWYKPSDKSTWNS